MSLFQKLGVIALIGYGLVSTAAQAVETTCTIAGDPGIPCSVDVPAGTGDTTAISGDSSVVGGNTDINNGNENILTGGDSNSSSNNENNLVGGDNTNTLTGGSGQASASVTGSPVNVSHKSESQAYSYSATQSSGDVHAAVNLGILGNQVGLEFFDKKAAEYYSAENDKNRALQLNLATLEKQGQITAMEKQMAMQGPQFLFQLFSQQGNLAALAAIDEPFAMELKNFLGTYAQIERDKLDYQEGRLVLAEGAQANRARLAQLGSKMDMLGGKTIVEFQAQDWATQRAAALLKTRQLQTMENTRASMVAANPVCGAEAFALKVHAVEYRLHGQYAIANQLEQKASIAAQSRTQPCTGPANTTVVPPSDQCLMDYEMVNKNPVAVFNNCPMLDVVVNNQGKKMLHASK